MPSDLDSLTLDLTGLTDAEIETASMRHYQAIYLDIAQRGIRKAHDGADVYFFRNVAQGHAFHKTVADKKDTICPLRVERVKWIKEFISGNVPGSECWLVPEGNVLKRIYCSFDPAYVIWLKPRDDGGWKFETAYPASTGTIRKYIQRRGAYRVCRF